MQHMSSFRYHCAEVFDWDISARKWEGFSRDFLKAFLLLWCPLPSRLEITAAVTISLLLGTFQAWILPKGLCSMWSCSKSVCLDIMITNHTVVYTLFSSHVQHLAFFEIIWWNSCAKGREKWKSLCGVPSRKASEQFQLLFSYLQSPTHTPVL